MKKPRKLLSTKHLSGERKNGILYLAPNVSGDDKNFKLKINKHKAEGLEDPKYFEFIENLDPLDEQL